MNIVTQTCTLAFTSNNLARSFDSCNLLASALTTGFTGSLLIRPPINGTVAVDASPSEPPADGETVGRLAIFEALGSATGTWLMTLPALDKSESGATGRMPCDAAERLGKLALSIWSLQSTSGNNDQQGRNPEPTF